MPKQLEGELSPGEVAERELIHDEKPLTHVQVSEEKRRPVSPREEAQRPLVPSEFVRKRDERKQ